VTCKCARSFGKYLFLSHQPSDTERGHQGTFPYILFPFSRVKGQGGKERVGITSPSRVLTLPIEGGESEGTKTIQREREIRKEEI
jgi:hypothetical protein